ncbi:MAG: zf-HC2 domain-containing protein [Acidobacteriota bacterium]|nr:zf-HC2 domain-containing protein [Acidobacteriota bacterium]
MNCAELEILLCDYIDGTLPATERAALELHLAGCLACTELAQDVQASVAFIERVATAEPPAELLTRILHDVPTPNAGGRVRAWWTRGLGGGKVGGWFQSILQPRYVMGMAMTVLSFSMLARFAGFEPRQLRASDLDPVKVWAAVDDRAHRTWDRAMKYYDNLRLVIEIQSRLKEWTDQEQAAPKPAAAAGSQTEKEKK